MAYTNSTKGGYSTGKSKGMAYTKQKSSMGNIQGYNAGAVGKGSASATVSYKKGPGNDINPRRGNSISIIGF